MNVATRGTNSVLTKGTTDLVTINRIGNGLLPNGVDRYVNCGSNRSSVEIVDSSTYTFAAIVKIKPITGSNEILAGYFDTNSTNGWLFNYNSSGIYFTLGGEYQRYIFGGSNFPVESVVRVVLVKNPNSVLNYELYIDGVLSFFSIASNTPVSNNLYSINSKLTLFSQWYLSAPLSFANSGLYDFKLFNKGLSVSEINQLSDSWHNNISGLTSNLVADYNFNKKSGTELTDNSVNQLHGTLTNFGATSNLGGGAWVNSLGTTITY